MNDVLNINLDKTKIGLKYFYDFKYKNQDLEYSAIPEIVNILNHFKIVLRQLSENDSLKINFEFYSELYDCLEKYFRSDFLECIDSRSIQQYLESKSDHDYAIKIEVHAKLNLKEFNQGFKDWIHRQFKLIKELKKYNRYNEDLFIKGVSIEEFENIQIRSFLKEFFISELSGIFAQFHVLQKLGMFKIHREEIISKEVTSLSNEKLKIDQIALYYFYGENVITRKNSNEIVQKYGHNSGEKLYQKFSFYSSVANRRGSPDSKRKFESKIQLFESIIPLLNKENIKLQSDLKILKNNFEKEYP